MLALNGIGLGHLIRSMIVSRALASAGERPVIFSEGKYRAQGLDPFPMRLVPPLWNSPGDVRARVASELRSMAGISLPAVVVEDTHPNPIQLPDYIRRVLLVRPTSFEHLLRMNESYGRIYAAFLLCDSPDSPTWPYDDEQTRVVMGWRKWHVIGPIYRTPAEEEIREVRARYALSEDEDLCIFSMGGGGVHVHIQRGQDVLQFLRFALKAADVVQGPRTRLLFVKGPYFPQRIPLPPRFEVVSEEQHMPALLKIAKGAVIRAGFNTTWECLAVGTPFLPLVGTTIAEPVPERISRLTAQGLIPRSPEQFWNDAAWRTQYRNAARSIVTMHSGAPEPHQLRRLIGGRPVSASIPKLKPPRIRAGAHNGIPFVIRIDDGVCKEPALCWLLALLASRGLRASVEVVPYLVDFDESFLDRFDPSGSLFEVSQHGYAHVPRATESGRRCEFSPESEAPTAEELDLLARGKQLIERAFPSRFRGGFSPPFDALPSWLPAAWQAMGGTFVTCLYNRSSPPAARPVVRAGVDVWNWAEDRAIDPHAVTRQLALQAAMDGHVGIVLHPRCLRSKTDKAGLRTLLKLTEKGTTAVSLRDIALGRVAIKTPDSRGARLWFSGGREAI